MLKFTVLHILVIFSLSLFAQSNPAEKKLDKIKELFDKNKVDKGEKQLISLLKEHADFGEGWDLLSILRQYEHIQQQQMPNLFNQLEITTTDEDGNEIKDDSLANSLMDMLSQVNSSSAYEKYVNTLRTATLLSNNAVKSSFMLRNALRDKEVDTNINAKALKLYRKAEAEFSIGNYSKAAKFYNRALKKQNNFYKAQLYLGDAYYFMGYYTDAIEIFKTCIQLYPDFVEPKKFLADAYMKEGLYDKAIAGIIEAILTYPDHDMINKLEFYLYDSERTIDVNWSQRLVFPNMITTSEINDTEVLDELNLTANKEHWKYYNDALDKIKDFCNEDGIITKPNELTSSKYLEVYSWEEMLKNSDDKALEEARRIQAAGYLDCYVLITCFHDDLFEQYEHFVKNNKAKVIDYYNNIVIVEE